MFSRLFVALWFLEFMGLYKVPGSMRRVKVPLENNMFVTETIWDYERRADWKSVGSMVLTEGLIIYDIITDI